MLGGFTRMSLGFLIREYLSKKTTDVPSILAEIKDIYVHWVNDTLFFGYIMNPRRKIDGRKIERGVDLVLRIGFADRGFVFKNQFIPFECSTFSYSKIILRKDELDMSKDIECFVSIVDRESPSTQ